MNAADVVKAINIVPGTLVVFGDMELSPDPDTDHELFQRLVKSLAEVVGHDQWLALRLHRGAIVGSYTIDQVIAALSGSTQEGTLNAEQDGHPSGYADHVGTAAQGA